MSRRVVLLCMVLLPLLPFSTFFAAGQNDIPESSRKCTDDADCGSAFCKCERHQGYRSSFCLHSTEYLSKLTDCPMCTSHSHCNTNDVCLSTKIDGKPRCFLCQNEALKAGGELCAKKALNPPEIPRLKGTSCKKSSECSTGCSCYETTSGIWCINKDLLEREMDTCPKCESGMDCRDIGGCAIPIPGRRRVCQTCESIAVSRSINACVASSKGHGVTSAPMNSSSKCFPGDAKVELHTKKIIPMSHLRIGDRIAVGRGRYSQVFMFTHAIPYNWYSFVALATASGHRIKLTSSHFIYVNGNLKPASTVRVGDVLTLSEGVQSRVTSVQHAVERGLFNPQTEHGDIVVNGIIVSTYTSTVSPKIAHAALGPVRALYVWLRIPTKFLE